MNRVVVTGFSGLSPIGCDWATAERALRHGQSGIVKMDEWDSCEGMRTRLAGVVKDSEGQPFEKPQHYTRKQTRGMGRVALLGVRASELALMDAGLLGHSVVQSGDAGVAYGSSAGGTRALSDFGAMIACRSLQGLTATTYVEMMPHTCAAHIGLFFGMRGRVIPTSSACTSASHAIGYAYESVRARRQEVMVAGGAEEVCAAIAAVFDVLYAASVRNDEPQSTPRPFDASRDGLVVAEGAGTLVLEELEHALARGATIRAEVVGFGSNSDGAHITSPQAETMRRAMELALEDAGIGPEEIGYINAHATATQRGDAAEARAMRELFGDRVPVSSLKGHIGHTLGAAGSLEAWLTLEMMAAGWFAPTLNLERPSEECAGLDHIIGEGRTLTAEYVMSNNFAFGGINTSLVFRRWVGC